MEENQRIKVGVYGASGYAGQDVVEILSKHPCAEVVFATSSTYAGQDVPFSDLKYIPHDTAPLDQVDAVFLALPHGVSANVAKQALDAGARVVDLSADFRLDTPESYQKWYSHPHPHPDLLPAPYGLPEINRDNLHDVKLIATPGCYPTTTILGLYPLLKAGWLQPGHPIVVDAKSGVSGAGRDPDPTYAVEVYGNFSPYSVRRSHRRQKSSRRIEKVDPTVGALIFTASATGGSRLDGGIYAPLADGHTSSEAQALYEATYAGEPLVNVLPKGQLATLQHVVRKTIPAPSASPRRPSSSSTSPASQQPAQGRVRGRRCRIST
ncbi:MAG: N-acetyl-gamma-glutamyl-phosphate reductase [Anaerolineae bacterium]